MFTVAAASTRSSGHPPKPRYLGLGQGFTRKFPRHDVKSHGKTFFAIEINWEEVINRGIFGQG